MSTDRWPEDHGPFRVYVAKYQYMSRKLLPKSQHRPFIDDGVFGEMYQGDSEGARELAAWLLAAADSYDELAKEMGYEAGTD
ncbi:Uncharacterised protein [Mycobacteroides abscessus subsp. abscessus]|uniref:hypothetical protein n=1 Tax=Mycobacteroides abscessus TaxID=36809 RepID=UPI0004475768|nr:hypothetical protein [Mycobacteroides abscessus]QPO17438.1 hypothetical protein PHIGD24-3_68 [Mycobacterium phage phiGD24-3]QSM02211.1 hypothetical protein PROPHIGD24-3_30 [Mycobacterium phage prophiGD24-3]QSM04346.1 hypothetical protein PROPHIGD43A-4_31 [Mycobacterium phage prophiGD43A-4]WJJ55740.1 hypothetical protein PROPHIT463_33 [Mycobacterium phage prophiT46-3]ETZ60899.1 hypothetical protein L836_2323 [Mycobacteroides abscessus MAB_110811_2726]